MFGLERQPCHISTQASNPPLPDQEMLPSNNFQGPCMAHHCVLRAIWNRVLEGPVAKGVPQRLRFPPLEVLHREGGSGARSGDENQRPGDKHGAQEAAQRRKMVPRTKCPGKREDAVACFSCGIDVYGLFLRNSMDSPHWSALSCLGLPLLSHCASNL